MKPKLFISVFFLLLLVTNTLGQITFTFTGIENSMHVNLDSIQIRNLDRDCDTTIIWDDTVLRIYPLGINYLSSFTNELQVFQNVPNPVIEKTKIIVHLPESGDVSIDVSLLNGKKVASFMDKLKSGYHSFIFTPGNDGVYILTVTDKSERKSIKIISTATNSSSGCILNYNGSEEKSAALKSTATSGKFIFSLGDHLELKGYHNTLSARINDVPSTNKVYIFNFSSSSNPCPGMPIVEYEGQIYNTVQIGTQCWLRENLNVGTKINGNQTQTNNGIIEKYCYDDIEANCTAYGGLYQWNEMMQYVTNEGVQGICPLGWHIPTDGEWCAVTQFTDTTVNCTVWGFSGTTILLPIS